MNWNHLNSMADLDKALAESYEGLVVLFKHSTRCSISRMALKMFEMGWDESLSEVKPYFLDLLNHRDISAEIASRLDVEHQSPQLIIVRGGSALGVANHSEINADLVREHA